jgi:hypothetical protein
MPAFLEQRLEAGAAKAGKSGRAADRYVYGAMNNMGAMHGNKETAKGKAMEAKHTRDQAKKKKGTAQRIGAQLMEV